MHVPAFLSMYTLPLFMHLEYQIFLIRDLRKARNRQKMPGGFRKESSHEMYCSILTVIETLKRRNMELIENIKMLFIETSAIF